MNAIAVVVRGAPRRCVEALENALDSLGFETILFVFGATELGNDTTAATLAEATVSGGLAQIWLVNRAFIDMEVLHRLKAVNARQRADLPTHSTLSRIYVVYDAAGPFANEAGAAYSLQDVIEGGPSHTRLLFLTALTGK